MITRSGISVAKAILYDKYRLPYAHQLVGDLLGCIGDIQVVADIGAGTGQLARMFAKRCPKVYAVEPDPAMHTVAAQALAELPGIELVASFAEQTTLSDRSIDLIVIGNAYHRFKPEACPELRRILKSQGWIALVSYTFLNQAFSELLFSKLAALKGLSDRIDKAWRRLPIQALFGDNPLNTLSYRQSYSEDWTAFFGAACAGVEAPEYGDGDFVQFEILNREVFDSFSVDGIIQVDYETRVQFGQPRF